MHAVILDNATVGEYAIVAAGSLVRELTEEERRGIETSAANYVAYAARYR
ncbi:MAG: hypothetical protein AB1428_00955 [Bacteroidota bacterium]